MEEKMRIVMCLFLALVSFVSGWIIGKKKGECKGYEEGKDFMKFVNIDDYKDYLMRDRYEKNNGK
jgi:hypothetical protein